MKYTKILGLLAVAAAALMAFAGVASATTVTSSAGETPTIKASSAKTELHNVSLGVTTTCTTNVLQTNIESHGAGKAASGKISTLTFSGCSNHWVILRAGTMSFVGTSTTGNATISASGVEITIQTTSLGIDCIYTASNAHIGTLTGGNTIKLDNAIFVRTGGSSFCGGSGELTGTYTISSPSDVTVH